MKVLIALVAAAALGAVGGAIYLGARLREPTVVADPYQAGLHYDEHRHPAGAACDLQSGPCTQRLPDGGEVTLTIGPRPVRAMRELEFTVALSAGSAAAGSEVAVALTMAGMYMGETRTALSPVGGGVFKGKGVVVRCPSGRRDWVAEVVVQAPRTAPGLAASYQQAPQRVARFPLVVTE